MPDYISEIPYGAPLDADTFNDVIAQANQTFNDVISGGTPLTGLNLGNPTELTIDNGVVVRAYPAHIIDTQFDASEDDLTTISGGTEGDILVIKAANATRAVVVKHGTGNIYLTANLDMRLDTIYKLLVLQFTLNRWIQIGGVPTLALTYNGLRMPDGMPVKSSPWGRNSWAGKASAAALVMDGMAAPTSTGTATASNDTDSTYVNYASGAVATNPMGIQSATFNLVRRQHNPLFSVIMRIIDITAIRLWVGLTSLAVTNVDSLAGTTEFVGFRFSPAAGDVNWTPVTKDATTQTTGSGTAPVAAGRYLLQMWLDDVLGRAIFRVNNGTPIVITTTLPAAATELGFAIQGWTTTSVIKNFKLSRYSCEYD